MRATCVLLLALGLVAWLTISTSQRERDWRSLDEARSKGLIATLTHEQAADLESIVRVAVNLAQPKQVFQINNWTKRDGLQIISYRSDVKHKWNLGLGNAVYNSRLDTIFLDEALVDVDRFVPDSTPVAVSPLRGFVFFAVLHELGHRNDSDGSRYDRNLGFISGSDSTKVAEVAADDYALRAIERASAASDPQIVSVFDGGLDREIGLECATLAAHELTYCRTATALWTAAHIYLIGASPFPPFYSNEAHPPLNRRATRLLQDPALLSGLSPALIAHAAVLREWFERLRTVSERSAMELFTDRPIEAASPVSQGWLAVAGGEYALFRQSDFSAAGVRRRFVEGQWKPIPNWSAENPNRYAHPFECAKMIWCVADLKQGDVQVLNDSSRAARIAPPPDTSGTLHISLPPGQWLYDIKDRELRVFADFTWHITDLEQLLGQVAPSPRWANLSLDVANAGTDWIAFGLVETGEEKFLTGWCWAPISGSVGALRCTEFRDIKWPLKNKTYQVGRSPDGFILYYATSNDSDKTVCILAEDGRQLYNLLIVTHDDRLRAHENRWIVYPAVWLGTMSVMNDGSLSLSYVGDSVYRISPSGKVSVLMHPASMLTPSRDQGAVMVPNGWSRSVYLID